MEVPVRLVLAAVLPAGDDGAEWFVRLRARSEPHFDFSTCLVRHLKALGIV